MAYNYLSCLLCNLALFAAVSAQAPPAPSLLTTVESGVLPILPAATPFAGVETLEGAIIYDGPMNLTATGVYGNASVQRNAAGAAFVAVLPMTNFDALTGSTITGNITGTVPANGTGVVFNVAFAGFPSEVEYGPFVYHVHGFAVPADGNCTTTLGHLDPTNRGEYYPCNAAAPATCQAGDLAGKHGNITGTTFSANYYDPYLSTDPNSAYYFGNKSIVIHSTNTTRLTCANFTLKASANASASASASAAQSSATAAAATSSSAAAASASARSAAESARRVSAGSFAMLGLLGCAVSYLSAF